MPFRHNAARLYSSRCRFAGLPVCRFAGLPVCRAIGQSGNRAIGQSGNSARQGDFLAWAFTGVSGFDGCPSPRSCLKRATSEPPREADISLVVDEQFAFFTS
jgi:hypothetical protein